MMTFSLVILIIGIGISMWGLRAMEQTANPIGGGFLRLTLGSNVFVLAAIAIVVNKLFSSFY